jgi:hypothetical protein
MCVKREETEREKKSLVGRTLRVKDQDIGLYLAENANEHDPSLFL